jgi:hypothetical protein
LRGKEVLQVMHLAMRIPAEASSNMQRERPMSLGSSRRHVVGTITHVHHFARLLRSVELTAECPGAIRDLSKGLDAALLGRTHGKQWTALGPVPVSRKGQLWKRLIVR